MADAGIRPSAFGIKSFSRQAWLVAAFLALTAGYAVLQVGFVRPYLPADSVPNLARPPVIAPSDTAALAVWRDAYRAGPGEHVTWRADPGGWARAHLGIIVQV